MSTISLLTVGTGTFSPKWPAKPTFQPAKLVNNAGLREVGNSYIMLSLRRDHSEATLTFCEQKG